MGGGIRSYLIMLQYIIVFFATLFGGITSANADGNVNFWDTFDLTPIVPTISDAFSDPDTAIAELEALDDEGKAQFKADFLAHGSINGSDSPEYDNVLPAAIACLRVVSQLQKDNAVVDEDVEDEDQTEDDSTEDNAEETTS